MKPPDREATREALDYLLSMGVGVFLPKKEWAATKALRAWSWIAPDADGEWSDEVVNVVSDALTEGVSLRGVAGIGLRLGKAEATLWAREVLAELVRLAEGSDDAD